MARAPFDDLALLGLAFALGAIVGSFANVCIHRLPRGRSVVMPRSACPGCGSPIAWFDNLPILSYAVLNGRCRGCKARIPFRYPLVEALTGLLFTLVFWKHLSDPAGQPLAVTAVYLTMATGLVIVTFIDLDFRIIFDLFSRWAAFAALPLSLFLPSLHVAAWPPLPAVPAASHADGLLSSLAGAVVGAGLIAGMQSMAAGYFWVKAQLMRIPPFRALASWAYARLQQRFPALRTKPGLIVEDGRVVAVGGGDVWLMAAVGGLLGWQAAVLVFFTAPVFGSILGLGSLLLTGDRYIPYGPFLALATVGIMLARREMLDFLSVAFHHPAIL